jgi:hypothetical protein
MDDRRTLAEACGAVSESGRDGFRLPYQLATEGANEFGRR